MNSIVTRLCLLALGAALAHAQIAGLKLGLGAAADGKIAIAALGAEPATEIPITLVRGAKPGPTLAIIAGLSGTDYAPIAAVHQVAAHLNPAGLTGSVVFVHIANVPAFLERAVYLNPIDHKDLRLQFPGKADGTLSERIAHAITTQVIDKADAVVLVQAGGSNTMLSPYVVQLASGDAKLDAKTASMAMAFGINYIVSAKASPATAEGVAVARSKATINVFCGSYGMVDGRTVDAITKGLLSVMALYEMIKENVTKARNPVFFDRLTVVESPQSGVLATYIQRGQNLHKGEPLFGVSGYTGKNIQVVQAPVDGILLSIVSTLPVNKGEPVAVIGILKPVE